MRKNDGYTNAIALFAFSLMVSVIGSLPNQAARQQTASRLADKEKTIRAYQNLSSILMAYLGIEGHSLAEARVLSEVIQTLDQKQVIADLDQVKEAYEKDMKLYIQKPDAGLDESYRDLIRQLRSAYEDRKEAVEAEKARHMETKKRLEKALSGK